MVGYFAFSFGCGLLGVENRKTGENLVMNSPLDENECTTKHSSRLK